MYRHIRLCILTVLLNKPCNYLVLILYLSQLLLLLKPGFHLGPGPKTNFLPHLPMAGDLIKFTVQTFFLPAMKLFLQKQAVITTTIVSRSQTFRLPWAWRLRLRLLLQWLNIFTMFLICPLLYLQEKNNKQIYWFIFFCPKNIEILVLCMFLANGAGHRVTPVSHILSLQNVCGAFFFPHTC